MDRWIVGYMQVCIYAYERVLTFFAFQSTSMYSNMLSMSFVLLLQL